jgi:hypothetical protein
LWERNPDIRNPDLIYPGDVIRLEYASGEPRLRVERGALPVQRLAPRARSGPLSAAIPTVPIAPLREYLTESRVVAPDALTTEPYVVAAQGKHLLLGVAGDRAYVRGISDSQVLRFHLFRPSDTYVDPDSGEVLGREALFVGKATLERLGDPATVRVESITRELLPGDVLLPASAGAESVSFLPHPVPASTRGRIIASPDGVRQVGRYSVVALNLGRRDGMEPGHVLGVFLAGERVPDPGVRRVEDPERFDVWRWLLGEEALRAATRARPGRDRGTPLSGSDGVVLPVESAGLVMVFRVFDRVSYALVMEAAEALAVNDVVARPVPRR